MFDTIETIEGIKFASHEDYGYITSCPSNLGTGMRASVHIQVLSLTLDGKDALLKQLCKPLGISVRGTGGEHTPIKDGLVDISPSSRLFVSEGDIVASLCEGIKYIKQIEDKVSTFLGINVDSIVLPRTALTSILVLNFNGKVLMRSLLKSEIPKGPCEENQISLTGLALFSWRTQRGIPTKRRRFRRILKL